LNLQQQQTEAPQKSQAAAPGSKPPDSKKSSAKRMYDINDQVNVVKQWWESIQQSDLEYQMQQ